MKQEVCVVDLCFFKTLFQSVFLLLIFETTKLHTNNPVLKHLCVLRVRILTCWNVWDFFNASQCQSMSCDHFCVIIDWSLIGRCQLTNKASIVIDWSIDFPIIGFINCSRPEEYYGIKQSLLIFQILFEANSNKRWKAYRRKSAICRWHANWAKKFLTLTLLHWSGIGHLALCFTWQRNSIRTPRAFFISKKWLHKVQIPS